MKVKLNRAQMDWLVTNCRFKELTDEQQQELFESIPDAVGELEWLCPSFASVLVRDRLQKHVTEQTSLLEQMNSGVVSGVLNLNILGTEVN